MTAVYALRPAMTDKQIEARRKGGLAFKAKYGREAYSEIGKLGGRPKLETLTEIRARQAKTNKRRCSNEALLARALELTAGRTG